MLITKPANGGTILAMVIAYAQVYSFSKWVILSLLFVSVIPRQGMMRG
jgi:hypothetical protein